MAITFLGPREELVNNWISTLTSGISAAATTIPVTDATGLPTTDRYRIMIGNEIIRCIGRTGNNLAVEERGAEGTSAVIHGLGSYAEAKLTAGSLRRFLLEHRMTGFSEESPTDIAVPLNRCLDYDGSVLTASSFTWVNQGSSTLSDHNGGLVMTVPAATGNNLRLAYVSSPSVPFRVITRCRVGPGNYTGVGVGSFGPYYGPTIRESSSGRLFTFHMQEDGYLTFSRWNSPTSFNADVDTFTYYSGDYAWLMIQVGGTGVDQLRAAISHDGNNWSSRTLTTWWSASMSAWFTGGGLDQVGIMCNANHASHDPDIPFIFDTFIIEEY